MEPVDTMVRVNGVQSVASRGPRSLVTATRLIRSVLLQIRQRFLVGPRKLTTDHPVQDQCSRVVSSLRVWSQYRPSSPPRDGNQRNPSAPAFAPTQATHYGVHPPHTPPTTQFPLSSRPCPMGATVMGFFFLLRRSEYLLHDNKIYQFAIRRSDIKFYDQAGTICEGKAQVQRVEINFRGGKNDQAGVGTSRSLTSSEAQWCCPVRAIWFLVEYHRTVSEDPDELLCKVMKNEFLRSNDVNKWIKKAANLAGQDSSRFSTHSLRIGGATALFAGGIDSLTIKLFGRWRSAVFERYTRIQAQVTTAMARCMINPSQAACSNQHQLQGHPPRHTRAGGSVNTTSYVPQN